MDRQSNFPYPRRSKPARSYADDDDNDDVVFADEIDESDDSGESDDGDEDYGSRRRRSHRSRHPKKHRKLSSCSYQFAPRAAASPAEQGWTEKATFVLLEIWGDRYLQLGRSSLRSEEWNDVAERVSEATRMKLSVADCRDRLNSLKLRYRREKMKGNGNSKWVFFKKMDGLMTMSPMQLQQQEQCGLACGVDSGEFVFMNPRVYLDHSNALDEMRDSPGESEDEDEGDDESESDSEEDYEEDEGMDEEEYRMLSESIKRVGEIYERIEDRKREHMVELERMRAEFQHEMETQKREMIERTRAEIEKLGHGDGDEEDSGCSAENP